MFQQCNCRSYKTGYVIDDLFNVSPFWSHRTVYNNAHSGCCIGAWADSLSWDRPQEPVIHRQDSAPRVEEMAEPRPQNQDPINQEPQNQDHLITTST